MLLLTGCLSGCALEKSDPVYVESNLPEYPVAGPDVAKELERVCLPADKCPALWEWFGRVDKLADQLCRPPDGE